MGSVPRSSGAAPLAYRPEIDGLRALAVVPVALFHARVPGFAGGFVGVDVFFVVSGYLITGILLRRDVRGGLAEFYERRARRILPALLPVLAATFVGAWLIFIPEDFRRYSQALTATALFASNLLFALKSDYFAGEGGFEPLIHGWSLSVEEQFYLLYPALLLFVARRWPRSVLPLAALLLGASFVLSAWLAGTEPRLAFNLLPTRAWELMAGALCALLPPGRPRTVPALAGLAMIAVGMTVIDPATTTPGAWFILPVAGAALVIRYAATGTFAARMLGWRPLVRIGLVSYGFYLWHQALLAFLFYSFFEPPPWWLTATTLGAALVLAAASYRWIERPVRQRRLLRTRRSLAALCLGGLAAAAAVGAAGHFSLIGPRSTPEAIRLGARYAGPTDFEQAIPPGEALPFLLYGDSHARQYYPALVGLTGRGAMLTASGCMALPDASDMPTGSAADDCGGQYKTAIALLAARRIPVLIWAQRWQRDLYRNSDGAPLGSTSEHPALLRAQLAAMRAALPARTRLVLVGNEPTAWAAGHQMDGGLLRCRAYRDARCPTSYPATMAEGRAANDILRAFAAATPGVTYVDAAAPLCPAGLCPILAGGRLYYSDGSHLTPFAAWLVVDRIATALGR